MLKKICIIFILTISITIPLFGLSLWLLQYNQAANDLSHWLQQSTVGFTFWRYSLLTLCILFWKKILTLLNHHLQLSPHVVAYLIHKRWYAFVFIIFFELMIALNRSF